VNTPAVGQWCVTEARLALLEVDPPRDKFGALSRLAGNAAFAVLVVSARQLVDENAELRSVGGGPPGRRGHNDPRSHVAAEPPQRDDS